MVGKLSPVELQKALSEAESSQKEQSRLKQGSLDASAKLQNQNNVTHVQKTEFFEDMKVDREFAADKALEEQLRDSFVPEPKPEPKHPEEPVDYHPDETSYFTGTDDIAIIEPIDTPDAVPNVQLFKLKDPMQLQSLVNAFKRITGKSEEYTEDAQGNSCCTMKFHNKEMYNDFAMEVVRLGIQFLGPVPMPLGGRTAEEEQQESKSAIVPDIAAMFKGGAS